MLRLVAAIDGKPGFQDILGPESIELMTNSRLSGGQPFGWTGTNARGNWWRTGTFAGTSALVVRQDNGVSYAVFFNSSTYRGTTLSSEITRVVQSALNRVENWPDHDLFYHFDNPPFLYPDIAELR